jgi:hypothetical protein
MGRRTKAEVEAENAKLVEKLEEVESLAAEALEGLSNDEETEWDESEVDE